MTLGVDGSVVSVSVTQPRFTAREKNLLLASQRADRVPRGAHGYPLSEATDQANQYRVRVPLPTMDFYAAKLHSAQEAYRKRYPDADMGALLWQLEDV